MFFRQTMKRRSTIQKAVTKTAIEALESRVLLAYTLDPSFSGDGIAEGQGTRGFAVQSDNKVVALVTTSQPGIRRLTTDGSPDSTFGTGGKVVTPFVPADLVISNGKIVVAGNDFRIARYNSNGTLDTTFGGGDGIAEAPLQHSNSAEDLALAPDGKLVLVGGAIEPDPGAPETNRAYNTVVRYNANGTLDMSFSGDGIEDSLIADANWGELRVAAVQSNGKIVLVGISGRETEDGLDWSTSMWRLDLDGTTDATFNQHVWPNVEVRDLDLQSDDKIVIASDFRVERYNPDGTIDGTFNTNGLGLGRDLFDRINGVQPLADGKILLGGYTDATGTFVARLLPSGDVDPTFTTRDKVIVPFGAADVRPDFQNRVIVSSYSTSESDGWVQRLADLPQSPFKGSPFGVSQTIQAEDFDTGGEGVAYHDTDARNIGAYYRTSEGVDIERTGDVGGGYNVGWANAGEWMEYTINVPAGTYTIDTRVATTKNGGSFHYEIDGQRVGGDVVIPNTGSYQTYQTVTSNLGTLSAGTHVLRLVINPSPLSGAVANFNWLMLKSTTGGGGGTGTGLKGEYFNNMDFTAPVFTRTDANINFNWGTGSPDPRIESDTFSVRWSGQIQVPTTGRYTFYTTTDDGVRLTVNGQRLIDKLVPQAATEWSGSIDLVAGQKYNIMMDYFERAGGAKAELRWSGPGIAKQIVPASAFSGGGTTTDTQAPSAVPNLRVTNVSDTEISVVWEAATDNVGVAGYELRLDNGNWFMLDPDALGWTYENLQPNTTHTISARAFDAAGNRGPITSVTATTTAPPAANGLRGQYFNNMDFTSPVLTRTDPTVNFNWSTGSPAPGIDADTFSVRWTGRVIARDAGRYTFYTTTDDGVRLTVNGERIIDKMVPQAATTWSGSVNLFSGGADYNIVLEYFERAGGASAKLEWSGPAFTREVIPQSNLSPQQPSNIAVPVAPVLVSATGETTPENETRVRLNFQPGDRTSYIFVERAPGGTTNFEEIDRFLLVPDPNTVYLDHNLPSNTTFTYRMRAWNDAGYSPYSNSLTVTTP
jgi:uncharacterized delta-60 repeat protein